MTQPFVQKSYGTEVTIGFVVLALHNKIESGVKFDTLFSFELGSPIHKMTESVCLSVLACPRTSSTLQNPITKIRFTFFYLNLNANINFHTKPGPNIWYSTNDFHYSFKQFPSVTN